jgi:hypothetical protein
VIARRYAAVKDIEPAIVGIDANSGQDDARPGQGERSEQNERDDCAGEEFAGGGSIQHVMIRFVFNVDETTIARRCPQIMSEQ